MGRTRNLWVFLGLILFAVSYCDLQVSADVMPSENECRPYIEKAIHELKHETETEPTVNDVESTESKQDDNDSVEESPNLPETITEGDGGSVEETTETTETQSNEDTQSQENQTDENNSVEAPKEEVSEEDTKSAETENDESSSQTEGEANESEQVDGDLKEEEEETQQEQQQEESQEEQANSDVVNEVESSEATSTTESEQVDESVEKTQDVTESTEQVNNESDEKTQEESVEENTTEENKEEEQVVEESKENETTENVSEEAQSVEEVIEEESVRTKRSIQDEQPAQVEETQEEVNESQENSTTESVEEEVKDNDSKDNNDTVEEESKEDETTGENVESKEEESDKTVEESSEVKSAEEQDGEKSAEEETKSVEDENATNEESKEVEAAVEEPSNETTEESVEEEVASVEEQQMDVEDLTLEFEIPKNLRSHEHVDSLLGLNGEAVIKETALRKTGDVVLKELKKVYDNAIKPLEGLYKYRELSNRHFGDPEIFSKPLVLFMGPWSGGKSTILNYLTENEYTPNSIRSGAEPSPAHFNILMHGDEPEVLDGTQLAADWTFSGLQKFGQGLMDRLRGQKLPNKLLERVNIVEIPGILEVRKQVSRYFPFNDACQWFIDRADIIFLVYDPSKLDVGPETEAILDQLKGREYQTRILLNKADQVKPEELLRVQGALIWNISPLMSSAQPPVMYTVSLWSHPFENGAPIRLLQAQEKAFLTDLREAIDKRIENKIASARRFAVRIRNHAKMVDCYLTTYYNQKGLFSNKKSVADKIIENPQNYNIYEGLSTLTNISRYDLPDPEVYLDFFRLNPLYEFKKLSETCTYFKGCPINKLDIAIAYDLPELVGKYKKLFEQNLSQLRKEYDENCNQTEIEPPVKINTR